MSIKHTDLGKKQETPPRDGQSFSTADTVQQGKASPPESFPPPRRPSRSNMSVWFAVAAVVVVVALIFSVFAFVMAQRGQHPTTQVKPTPTAPATTVTTTPTPTPGVTQGPQNGPASVSDPAYWTQFVTAPPLIRDANSVSFAHMLGNSSLQAVVVATEILGGGPAYRDIFVFDKITDPHPQLLFQVNRLLHGDARISGYSTLMTAQVDVNSSLNKGKLDPALTTDLYREFKWSDGAGIFVPTAFPGLFPDLTRWQAEMDQNAVKTGQDSWKTNAVQVAQRMAAQLLKWPSNAAASLLSGGGPQDVDAVVQVKNPSPGGMSVNVTLSRLEGNTSSLWVVIGVTSGNGLLTITTPVKGDRLSSPTTITGSGSAFEGVIGQTFVLDHLYTTIGQAQVLGAGNGKTTYSVSVPYTSSFQAGIQEGIVVVYMYSQADGSIATAAMQKVMLG